MTKVLFVASEALPFAATGGLADVAGSLPQELSKLGADVRVVMPLYGSMAPAQRDRLTFLKAIGVPLAWRQQHCGIFGAVDRGVTYYLLDNEQYFGRGSLYGQADDTERFAFFSKAALEILQHIRFQPDVIHSNDWHTALVPVFYKAFYADMPSCAGAKNVFTIHNIQYQGEFNPGLMGDVMGLGAEWAPVFDYALTPNAMKGAIETADMVTTVSPTYASEITTPAFGHGLDALLRERAYKLRGILNGIDVEAYNPETDSALPEAFSAEYPGPKADCKAHLQAQLGLKEEPGTPLMAMITRFTEAKGIDLVTGILEQLMQTDVQLALLGTGDARYEVFFREMQAAYPGRLSACLAFDPLLARRMYAGADLFLMPSRTEACGLAQMISLRYGTIPIVRETGGLKDTIKNYDEETGQGNGFTFINYDAQEMLSSIARALRLCHDGSTWARLVARAMGCDNSWGRSAKDYLELYEEGLR